MANWQEIKVNSKILGHISAGIYRSPAGALKELVSNAFDADATRVAITTNWPSFDIITCSDNGSGMTQEKFENIMTQEIGDSAKRVATDGQVDDVTNLGRPIIGWLGIGMLGIAQICHEFKIISHHKESQTAFEARVRLVDFLREKVSHVPPDEASTRPIDVGEFTVETIDYEPDEVGTYIIAADIRSAFLRKFRETSAQDKDALPSKFAVFLKEIHRNRSVKNISDYWQMVWELTVACPVPYVDGGPFDWERIEVAPELKEQLIQLQHSLNNYAFQVVVDGLTLRKPNRYPLFSPQLPKSEETTGKLFAVNREVEVYGRPLKLSGYIYLQDGRAVEPMELRGLLVRIRNIAIGTYDSTLFNYPKIPIPRFNWISGEIYVEAGLEFALNIDRASFNEVHPHFVKLKEVIHELLRDEIFPEAQQGQKKRSQANREDMEKEKQVTLNALIHRELGDTDEKLYPIDVDIAGIPESKRELIKFITWAFEISMQVPEKKRRERFEQLLSEFVKSGLL